MEFVEILALIKKAIFLVGGACVVILLYYKYGKNKKSIAPDPVKEEPPKDDTPVVNVRRCEFIDEDNRFIDPSEGIDIDRNESRLIHLEESPVEDFLGNKMSQEKRAQMIKDLEDLGYHGSWRNTEENADPFED